VEPASPCLSVTPVELGGGDEGREEISLRVLPSVIEDTIARQAVCVVNVGWNERRRAGVVGGRSCKRGKEV